MKYLPPSQCSYNSDQEKGGGGGGGETIIINQIENWSAMALYT